MKKTILFQGDSVTDCGRNRCSDAELGDGYPRLIEASLGFDAPGVYRFVNRGISGDQVASVYKRLQADILDVKPDFMSLLIGVNDIWHPLDQGIITDTVELAALLETLVGEVQRALPQTTILLMAPFILRGAATEDLPDMPGRFDAFFSGVRSFAEQMQRVAERRNVLFLDLKSAFDDAAKKAEPSYWLADGVHPTAKGHELIKREWLRVFTQASQN